MRLDFIKPLVPYIPEVKPPIKATTVKEKFVWTAVVLLLFYIMYHIVPFGADLRGGQFIEFIQVVLASKMGTLLTIGIGPIVLASIILQLFAGAKIIDIDLQNPEDKALFTATQKSLAIVIAIVEAALFVLPGAYLVPSAALTPFVPAAILTVLIILQIAFASIILLFMDEITSRYGIGSGISLFIAAGVSLAIVQGSISLVIGGEGIPASITVISKLTMAGALAIPSALIALLPIIFTLIIIFVCLYAEGVKVEIPLAFDRFRGFGSRFPVKLLYVSVLPVILTAALMVNVELIGKNVLYNASFVIGDVDIVPYIGYVTPDGRLADGFLYLLTSFANPLFLGYEGYLELLASSTPLFHIPQIVHIIVYTIVYVGLCVFFGKFWIEAAGMGPADIADQITRTGLAVPGFRRDPRIIQAILEKYISTITVVGSIFVGLLAVLANLTGAVGTGTGILLTVGIMYKFYEDFKAQKMFDAYPQLSGFFGLGK